VCKSSWSTPSAALNQNVFSAGVPVHTSSAGPESSDGVECSPIGFEALNQNVQSAAVPVHNPAGPESSDGVEC